MRTVSSLMAAAACAAFLLSFPSLMRAADPRADGGAEYTLSGPYTVENLTVYLVHGKDRFDGSKYLTLQEAMEQKKVVVHETGSVNELSIENVGDREVYVQSGDIVKGGKQDRTLRRDFILGPKSGKVPVDAFCVEHGRWSQRGNESAGLFGESTASLSSKDLKLAAKQERSQEKVWSSVDKVQEKMMANAPDFNLQSSSSPSSLQLTMEDDKVKESIDAYMKKLGPILDEKGNKSDVIGYAFAINGKMNSADVYGSSSLFRRLLPKMLNATAVEALAAKEKGKTYEPVAEKDVRAMLSDAERGKQTETEKSERMENITRESENNLLFESRPATAGKKDTWVHRNYMTKE